MEKQKKETPQAQDVYTGLFEFQKLSPVIPRRGRGTSKDGKEYSYVLLDDLIPAVNKVLHPLNMGFTQVINDKKLITSVFHLGKKTTFINSELELGNPASMQDFGARITYAKRYALTAILGLSTEDDLDASFSAPTNEPVQVATPSTSSDAYTRAVNAIQSAYNADALEIISGQIERSTKLADDEKIKLKELLQTREHETDGTIR